MKTPFKLKRDAPETHSTLDRTALITNRTSQIGPSFLPPPRPPPSVKPSILPLPRSSAYASTAELEKQIEKIMMKDETQSQRNRTLMKGGHSYSLRPLQSRIVLAAPWEIPERVSTLYQQASAKSEGKCEFKQGLLPTASLYYFAVGRKVLFYDVGRAIQTGSGLEESFMHECEFESTVYQLRQLSWRHPLFGEFRNRSILLICCPWKFCFAALELQGVGRVQAGPRWMRLTLLNPSFDTATQISSHIIEDQQKLYYLDSEGGVNIVSIQRNTLIGRLMGDNSKYRLTQNTQPSSISTSAFFISRKATFLERLQHYSKVIYTKATSFYGRKVKNLDLVYDNRRKLLFSLVDTNHNHYNCLPSNYKLLTAWSISEGKLTKKAQISQGELYEREIDSIASFGIASNYRIAKLSVISPCVDSEANLMIILECGLRLYLSAENTFRVLYHHLPPSIEQSLQRCCEPKQYHKQVELTHYALQDSNVVLNLKEEGENHTLIIWKPNEEKQGENCVQLTWGSNMSSPSGNPPLQNYLQQFQLALAASKKSESLKSLSSRCSKSYFSGSSGLPHLHQLARDLFLPPMPYLHSSDTCIQHFCIVRPIDKMFSAVVGGVRDQTVLVRMFDLLPCEEIQFLLLQLFCDVDGLYLKDLELIDSMAYFNRKIMQQTSENFEKSQREFAQHSSKAFAGKGHKQIQPMYVGRQTLTSEMQEAIMELLVRLGRRGDDVGGRIKLQAQIHRSVCNAIMIYLARLLRFLWKRNMSEINSKVEGLIPMIEPLHRILDYLRSPLSKSKTHQTKQLKLERLAMRRKASEDGIDSASTTHQPILLMGRLINKVTQLMTLCMRIDLKLDKSFSAGLAMERERFEPPLFRYLIDKYDHPSAALDVFRQLFPCFVGESLEKSLRIFEESKTKSENEIVTILRFHKKIPNYLLKYYENANKLHPEEVRALRSTSANAIIPQKIHISACNVKEGVVALLEQLKQSETTLSQRNLTMVQLNSLLAQYLRREEKEDRFYREKRGEVEQISRRLTMQQIIIDEYEYRSEAANIQIVNELKSTLFEIDVLRELVESLKAHTLTIIFTLLFDRLDDPESREKLEEGFKGILQLDCQRNVARKDEGFLSKTHSFFQNKFKSREDICRWLHMQQSLKSIISSVRSAVPFSKLLQLITTSLLSENSTSPVISLHTIQHTLPTFVDLFSCKDKQKTREELDRLPFPLISIILWRVGSEESDIQSFYEDWLRKESEKEAIFDDRKEALYHWVNYLVLSLQVEPRGEFFLYNSKKFIENYLKRFPEQESTCRSLKELCQCFSKAHGLLELYNDIF